ncbi:hypothetical protein SAMN05519104_4395 [Rhizobiales bacterium GAS188]|nr:hypothetical protein SAMN05519104_4395 [Rhizobiales bacterium GAS188]
MEGGAADSLTSSLVKIATRESGVLARESGRAMMVAGGRSQGL